MIIQGDFQFPKKFPGIIFTDIDIQVGRKVLVDPDTMTIDVHFSFTVEGSLQGNFAPDINPVPVNDLNYNGDQLVDRILERIEDFRVNTSTQRKVESNSIQEEIIVESESSLKKKNKFNIFKRLIRFFKEITNNIL